MKKLVYLLVVVFALSGCTSTDNMVKCGECDSEYPEKYGVSDFFGDTVCPSCAEDQISFFVEAREEAYDSVQSNGDYVSDDDYLVIEKSECNWCGNYAPSDLYDQNGERICIDCITEALQDDNVARAVWNYYEYG